MSFADISFSDWFQFGDPEPLDHMLHSFYLATKHIHKHDMVVFYDLMCQKYGVVCLKYHHENIALMNNIYKEEEEGEQLVRKFFKRQDPDIEYNCFVCNGKDLANPENWKAKPRPPAIIIFQAIINYNDNVNVRCTPDNVKPIFNDFLNRSPLQERQIGKFPTPPSFKKK